MISHQRPLSAKHATATYAVAMGLLMATLWIAAPVLADHTTHHTTHQADDPSHKHTTESPDLDAADLADAAIDAATISAMGVLDDFMTHFNQRDMAGWAATLNYPHVRFASGTVTVWDTRKEFTATPPFKALAGIGWDHSHWLSRDIVLASAQKVHIATVFERFDANNQSIGVYESLYIVTKKAGRWGIQARSSLAP